MVWGALFFCVGLIGWVESVNLYAVTIHPIPYGATGPAEWKLIEWLNIFFGLVLLISLPLAVVAEVARRKTI